MAEVTIKDVARAARVSVTTVSRVINDNPRVNPELADRVQEAVERLGYRPSINARRLVAGRTWLVGALVPDLSNPFFPSLLRGLTAAAEEVGYSVVIAETGEHVEREMKLSLSLLAQTDALVFCSPRMDGEQLRDLAAQPAPTVCVNRMQTGVEMPFITANEYEASLSLAGHLVSLGHRRVAYLQGPPQSWSNAERSRGLRAASAFGLDVVPLVCGSDLDAGFAVADDVLRSGASAAVAFNDYVALGVLSALNDRGVRVPEDLSLAGFDDIPFSAFASPPITSVRRPAAELGREAWRAVEARLQGLAVMDPPVLPTEVVVRASTAKPHGSEDGTVGDLSRFARRP